MNELKLIGSTNILGINVPNIEGGFSEGQKVILAKTIADIHEIRVNDIQDLINNNINEFDFGIDILDLKVTDTNGFNLEKLGFTKMQIAKSKNIYLLSEQGYMLLVGLMRTDKAKEIRKQLRRNYFAMREIINSNEQLKAKLLLDIYNGGNSGVIASKKLVELETKPLLNKIEEDKPLVGFAESCLSSKDSILVGDLAKIVYDEGMNIGQNNLYKKLREWKYICKKSTNPTQYAIDRGYFEVIQRSINTPYGIKLRHTTKVLPKGQVHIIQRLKEEYKN